MCKLVIFDCDGVLVDSEHLASQALVESLSELELPTKINFTAEEAMRRFKGRRLAECLREIEGVLNCSLPDTFEATFRRRMSQSFESHLQPVAGAEEAVKRTLFNKCVASNGPLLKTRRNLEITELAQYFGNDIFSAYTRQKWKPDPDLFLHACAQMGSEPSQCVVVEDSESGVQAARSGGFKVLALGVSSITDANVISFSSMLEIPNLVDRVFSINC